MAWNGSGGLTAKSFVCGYCGKLVASAQGFHTAHEQPVRFVYICPNCTKPTYFDAQRQIPGVAPGVDVAHLPSDVEALYAEARNCVAAACYTAAVLAARKLLMHIAVAQDAPPGKNFLEYVEHLASSGYVPPNGRGWVDHIRKRGNEANHEIRLMSRQDAEELISFSEMLLKFIYEFPQRVPKTP
jgi:hypothetical protein